MAKLDDFGRPIYETAEEYNKAHRAGGTTRTYESPDGDTYQHKTVKENHRYKSVAQRHATVQGSKNAKKIVLAIGIFVLAMNMGIIVSMFNMVGGSFGDADIEYGEEWIGTEVMQDGDDTIPLPEGFETFSYNGQYYTLPAYYEDFAQIGFISESEYEEDDLFPSECEELLFLEDEEGYTTVSVRVNNYTGVEIPLRKCEVDYFYIDNPAAYDETAETPDFIFGDGLTFDSSYEDLEAYFGIPTYHYSDHSEEDCFYDNYEWAYYGDEEVHFVSITFWNDVIDNVSIEKRAYEEKY